MNLKELLAKRLTVGELANVKTAFDIVGDIAIIEVPHELELVEKIIAEAVLELNKNIKVVVKKSGGHSGEFRIQDYKILAGEQRFVTEHKESNVRLKLDITKTYFSARLATERLRISKLIKNGERILVMFAGCGPYPLVFAKNSSSFEIIGVEINPDACDYFTESIKLNKVKNVKVICNDMKNAKLDGKFDRIIMPLPESSFEFLDIALKYSKRGTVIHYYCFSHEDEFENVKGGIISKCGNVKFLDLVKCGQRKPRIWRICVDFEVLY